MTEEEKVEAEEKKEEVSHSKQIQQKPKELTIASKDMKQWFKEFNEKRHNEDWGDKTTMQELGEYLGRCMDAVTQHYADVFTLSKAAAELYLDERLKAPVMGEYKTILKNFIDEWVKHVNLIDSGFIHEMLSGLEYAEKLAFQEIFGAEEGKKKGIISKVAGKVKDTTIGAADKTTRTATFNVVKLKERREIKL